MRASPSSPWRGSFNKEKPLKSGTSGASFLIPDNRKIPPGRPLGIFLIPPRKSTRRASRRNFFAINQEPGSDLLWHARKSTLPSAQNVFTSEFEMGSGGSRSLWPPGKLVKNSGEVSWFRRLSRSFYESLGSGQSKDFDGPSLEIFFISRGKVFGAQRRNFFAITSNHLRLYGQASRAISTG